MCLVKRRPEEYGVPKTIGRFLTLLNELTEKHGPLPREKLIVVYCHHGNRSMNAMRFLMQKRIQGHARLGWRDTLVVMPTDPSVHEY